MWAGLTCSSDRNLPRMTCWVIVLGWLLALVGQLEAYKNKHCLEHPTSARRRVFFNSRNVPIVIEVSERESHAIVSHILKLLLTEYVGYETAFIRHHDSIDTAVVMDRLSGCVNASCAAVDQDRVVPKSMVNLEVWMVAGESMAAWTQSGHVAYCGPLGPYARFGWYMPKLSVLQLWKQERVIADHWRALKLRSVVDQFSVSNISSLRHYLVNAHHPQRYYCESKECQTGIYYGPGCSHNGSDCSMLFSTYPDSERRMEILIAQVEYHRLPVNIAWVGSRLNELVADRLRSDIPTLLFTYNPDSLTVSNAYTRIKFPECWDTGRSFERDDDRRLCDFSVNQKNKVMWGVLRHRATEAYQVVSGMTFSQRQYTHLLQLYNERLKESRDKHHGDMNSARRSAIRHTACDWIHQNTDTWIRWMPGDLSNTTSIYLGGLFPMSGGIVNQPGLVAGAKLALELVNRDVNILPFHNLSLLIEDSQCMPDVATKSFIKYVTNKKQKIAGILGPGCSDAAEPIAALAKHFNMITVSYEAEAMSLSNRKLYPYFFRTIPQISLHRFVYAEFFKLMGWRQAGTLAESGQELPEYHTLLGDFLSTRGINIVLKRRILRSNNALNLTQVFADIKRKNVKIIICDVFESAARAIMCEAYKQKMTAKQGYVWFLPDWFNGNWYMTNYHNNEPGPRDLHIQENVPCNNREMRAAVEGHFILSKAFYDKEETRVAGDITVREYRDMYERRAQHATEFASYVYDSVWVWAYALDKVLTDDPSAIERLHEKGTTAALVSAINSTNFQGVTGKIAFEGADRLGIIHIEQYYNRSSHLIGRYTPRTRSQGEGSLKLDVKLIRWNTPDSKRPTDGMPASGINLSPNYSQDPHCSIELIRALLKVSCESAIIIVNIVSLCIFIIITLISLFLIKKRYDSKVRATRERMKELGLLPSDMSAYLSLDDWEIAREQVVLNRKLGEGAFGMVYGGEVYLDGRSWVAVAVKTLKEGSAAEDKLDFLSEAEMMKRFCHHNIIELLGVCTRGEPAYAIMEFMLHGDLKTYLLSRRNLVGMNSKESEDVSPFRLTHMAIDVASGLKYLHDMKYVHRDLACRNCLVHSSKLVKIGDFGMTRPMYDSDYYRFNRKGMLPVRWMSPESLRDGLFTAASDTWSYGVLIFEIVTFGSFPYQGLSNNQVLEHVKSGNPLTLPKNCPIILQNFIRNTMTYESSDRISASEILEVLQTDPEFLKPYLDAPITSVVMGCTDSLELNQLAAPKTNAMLKRSASSLERLALFRSNLHVPTPQSVVLTSPPKPASPALCGDVRRHSVGIPRQRVCLVHSQSSHEPLTLYRGGESVASRRSPPILVKISTSDELCDGSTKELCQTITSV